MRIPQLRMKSPPLEGLPELSLPQGAAIRTYAPGDEALWVKLLIANGELGPWNHCRAKKAFSGPQRVWRESIHFLYCDGEPVATSCVQLHGDKPRLPELGWVATLPNHRRKGFGRAVSLAAMYFMKSRGYERCFLRVSDRRLAAITLYLGMGFAPELEGHPSFPERWDNVLKRLG